MNLFSGRTGDNYVPQCGHEDRECVNDSFDHEFGTEVCYHDECRNCGAILECTHEDYDYDY